MFNSTLLQYLSSIVAVFCITGLLWVLRDSLSVQIIALIYLLPIVIISRIFGLFPAILAAILSFLSFNYCFIPPYYTLAVHRTQDLITLIVFLVIATVISQLQDQDRQKLAAITAREREVTHLYDLSIALAGLQDDKSIIKIFAEKIRETFQVESVNVTIQDDSDKLKTTLIHVGTNDIHTTGSDLTIPLSTARGEYGVVQINRSSLPLSSTEQRLLTTFISQGALALERANLIEINNRAKVLEESDKLKTSLLSSVSHELRTPLATIKASISSLRSKAVILDSQSKQDLLGAIEEETDHLNQLVGNLLDMSKIETGALNPQWKWNALNEIINGVLKRMNQVVKNHIIRTDIPVDLPLVPVDYVQMEQVFSNLLSNSVKYAPRGTEILIRVHPKDDQWVFIQIVNQSPHIREEHLERIFDKFYRVNADEKVTGTGLGLSICKGIIEAHAGRIWASNESNGFAFNFLIPLTWEGVRPQVPKEI